MVKNLPIVAIIGRPNVGKSSLINRIIKKREAIVHGTPGVTRDRKYFTAVWNNKPFKLIDTGGIYTDEINSEKIIFQKEIEAQVEQAVREADVIIFLVDGMEGSHPYEHNIAKMLRPLQKKIVVAVNKIDIVEKTNEANDFYQLGFSKIIPISALHGLGVGDLLDYVVEELPSKKPNKQTDSVQPIKVAIVGRPNAGKSSLLNSLLNEPRVIVSPTAGTTRDSVSEEILREGRHFIFVDTAGIRKKAKVNDDVEYYSVNRAIKAIEEADICILVIDAQYGIEQQDKKIAEIIQQNGKGCILAINKWDLVKKDTTTLDRFTDFIRRQIAYLSYAPLVFISALTKQRVPNIYKETTAIFDSYSRNIETAKFNKALAYIVSANPPKMYKGKQLKIYYGTQIKNSPPTFLLFVNNMKFMQKNYLTYLEKQLREALALYGTPLRFVFRNKINKQE